MESDRIKSRFKMGPHRDPKRPFGGGSSRETLQNERGSELFQKSLSATDQAKAHPLPPTYTAAAMFMIIKRFRKA